MDVGCRKNKKKIYVIKKSLRLNNQDICIYIYFKLTNICELRLIVIRNVKKRVKQVKKKVDINQSFFRMFTTFVMLCAFFTLIEKNK